MNAPYMSAPVARGPSKYAVAGTLEASGCNILSCGAKVIACAGSCIPNPFNSGCISCLGSAWNECKDCF